MALDKIQIEGGHRLEGSIEISGAKNAALPLLSLALLSEGTCTIRRAPYLHDIGAMFRILEALGAEVKREESRLTVSAKEVNNVEAPYDFVRKMRASVLMIGPLLARFGKAKVSLPGGCAIGVRPIDQHLKAFEALGAKIEIKEGYVEASAKQLKAANFRFETVSVTGTINALAAASMAEGESVFENCAREPEVAQACEVLNAMGAELEGIGRSQIKIIGNTSLKSFDVELIPDRIETGTYLVAAAITGGDIFLEGANATHLQAVIKTLKTTGVSIEEKNKGLHVKAGDEILPCDIKTAPHPGFPTDMQAQMTSLLSLAKGKSVITETIFENRFMHVPELIRMGADLKIEGHNVIIKGVKTTYGCSRYGDRSSC